MLNAPSDASATPSAAPTRPARQHRAPTADSFAALVDGSRASDRQPDRGSPAAAETPRRTVDRGVDHRRETAKRAGDTADDIGAQSRQDDDRRQAAGDRARADRRSNAKLSKAVAGDRVTKAVLREQAAATAERKTETAEQAADAALAAVNPLPIAAISLPAAGTGDAGPADRTAAATGAAAVTTGTATAPPLAAVPTGAQAATPAGGASAGAGATDVASRDDSVDPELAAALVATGKSTARSSLPSAPSAQQSAGAQPAPSDPTTPDAIEAKAVADPHPSAGEPAVKSNALEAPAAKPGSISAADPLTEPQHGAATPQSAAESTPDMPAVQPQSHPAPVSHSTSTAPLMVAQPTSAAIPLNAVAVQIAVMAQSGASRFEIRLDPAELGRIDVRIEIDRHGQVTSHLTVEKPETLAMLRQDAPQLQRALDDAGFKSADSGLQFSLRDQSSSGQNHSGDYQGSRRSQRVVIGEQDGISAPAGRGYGRMPGATGGVDIRV